MRRPGALRRVGVVLALAGGTLFALGAGAWAADGPTPPKIGDPVGADVVPHGGYSSTSNYCLQCHEVHKGSDYALLWKASVTATCDTCHSRGGAAPTGTRDPIGGGTVGTASVRAVYTVGTAASKHTIGSSSPPGETGVTITQSDWSYGWNYGGPSAVDATTPAGPGTASDTGGGLYCASCHTPHGDYGQAVNSKWVMSSDSTGSFATQTKKAWAEGTQIWWNNPNINPGTGRAYGWQYKYLHKDTDPANVWEFCDTNTPTAVAGDADSGCAYAQVKDAENQLVSMYGYKLLSAYPNHSYASPKSVGADKYDHDSGNWCGSCHPSRVDSAMGGTFHNHPTGCSACHGNPSDGTSSDYPHSSTMGDFLKTYPDALCVSCHLKGGLP